MNKNKTIFLGNWLKFSFGIAFIPFMVGLFAEIMNWFDNLINDKFWDLSWTIKIISYLVVGFFVTLWYLNYLKNKKENQKK